MKLQVALDRISLDEAINLASKLNGKVDIIEIGTSLIKDYGNLAIDKIKAVTPKNKILVDSKTIDEGAYEFEQAFKHGADIVTVMGAASYQTLLACYEMTKQYGGTMMIDLLNLNYEQIVEIDDFSKAIYLVHHSVDANEEVQVANIISEFKKSHAHIERIAIAGGIDYESTEDLNQQGIIEIVVVGSKIIKSKSVSDTAGKFMEVLNV
ncbi:orotidine 5'-phosphate decarboxylase / HUMPS family protein [Staphylococcus xylosus]|uniref:orotidine 5'-phosphate decarboxylase / HUMPS family protein n=1 Tax=Staphylococcus xylosus TaxID=1288 RepID=UPI001C3EA951|nr:orotidine 5'-phosphate decarboxylase / HUMPS family protein [Staphylococcus xylosus]MCI8277862.1 3-hexulose-6-phosphate synthase [Staphylococcus xylosus]